jgi:hypothetical protein
MEEADKPSTTKKEREEILSALGFKIIKKTDLL